MGITLLTEVDYKNLFIGKSPEKCQLYFYLNLVKTCIAFSGRPRSHATAQPSR